MHGVSFENAELPGTHISEMHTPGVQPAATHGSLLATPAHDPASCAVVVAVGVAVGVAVVGVGVVGADVGGAVVSTLGGAVDDGSVETGSAVVAVLLTADAVVRSVGSSPRQKTLSPSHSPFCMWW